MEKKKKKYKKWKEVKFELELKLKQKALTTFSMLSKTQMTSREDVKWVIFKAWSTIKKLKLLAFEYYWIDDVLTKKTAFWKIN